LTTEIAATAEELPAINKADESAARRDFLIDTSNRVLDASIVWLDQNRKSGAQWQAFF
jgi:hypothetical protein